MAREMYNYFCKDKGLVLSTILWNFTTKDIVYDDDQYGMKSWQTLKMWIIPALEQFPERSAVYAKIMDHFGFTSQDMDKIYSPKSMNMLLKLIQMMKNLMRMRYMCKLRDCKDEEIVMNQFVY